MVIGNAPPRRGPRDRTSLPWRSPKSIRVLIADYHAVIRIGFSSVCKAAGLTVVGLAKNEEELLELSKHSDVDVLLLDTRMKAMVAPLQKSSAPTCRFRTIALSNGEPDGRACNMVEAGAIGFLLKDSSRSQIVETIETVYFDEKCLPSWIRARISESKTRPGLSQRELEVLEMVSKGLTNKEIANIIRVSHFTVRNHVRRIIDKLDVSDRTEAATLAIQQGILSQYGVC
jgi:two-component system NarL family response regulator